MEESNNGWPRSIQRRLHRQLKEGEGLLASAAANKGATARTAGGLIEPLACAGASIDRQTERDGQTKNDHSDIKIFKRKKAAACRGRQALRESSVSVPHYSLMAVKRVNLF